MIRSSAAPHEVAKWVATASVIAALGCTTTQPIPVIQTWPFPEPQWNTPLPPGVNSNPREFQNSVEGNKDLMPADTFHVRARAGACFFCIVHVRIQALGQTWRIKPDSGPAMGIPVARIQNLDASHREARYGFRPETEAIYYFWVDRNPGSTQARFTVLQVPLHGGVVTAGHQKTLRYCHYQPGRPARSDADFLEYRPEGPCTYPISAMLPAISKASLFPGVPVGALVSRFAAFIARGMGTSQGGWIDCNSGCCI